MDRMMPKEPKTRQLGLISFLIGLLPWLMCVTGPVLFAEVRSLPPKQTELELRQQHQIVSVLWMPVLPSLFAGTACIVGTIAVRKWKHSSNLTRFFSSAGIVLGGVFLAYWLHWFATLDTHNWREW
jgi:hypothetical protein